jgi:tetratricopeptide (TPR) repeat protein
MRASVDGKCPCGSGLRAIRCCSLNPADFSAGKASQHLKPIIERAVTAQRKGEIKAAERLCLEVLELAPTQSAPLIVLYEIRRSEGVTAAAEALLRRAVTFEQDNYAATHELALLLLSKRALQEAEVHARNLVRLEPESPRSHNVLGLVLTEANRPQVGEYHYRKVLELSERRDPVLLANLAWNLRAQGRMDEARALYREAVDAAPDIREYQLGWARLEEADRQFDAAAEILNRAEARWPHDPGLLLARATLLGRLKRYDEALDLIDSLSTLPGKEILGPNELSEKGRLLDQMGRYDDAFSAFEEGKRLFRELSRHSYADAPAAKLMRRLRLFFTASRIKILPRASLRAGSAQPIFVVGFPRSGTTLMEQTLSSHPRIVAGDELPFINDLTGLMPRMWNSPLSYPEALAELWMGDHRSGLDDLRDHYLRRVEQSGLLMSETKWFTDKMPLNETHLGLISLIFPQSPIVHVIRHPLDVMVSAMTSHFSHGFFCSSALETAARHYVRVMDLVDAYLAELDLRYMRVRYEDVVSEQEKTVRSVFDFIGEEFDPRCLSFQDNRRFARTASYAQVTEPLYDRSRYRYRNYMRHLQPILPILEPYIMRLGYSV